MSGNRIAHTLLHRARRAAASSSFSSAGRPSSLVSCAEARSSQSSCFSSSRHVHFRRQHAFAFSPSATMRLFNTNSSKDFEDEVKEQNPLQYGRDEREETTDGWEEDDDLEPELGDGGGGGGVVLQDVPWGERVLSLAHEVLLQFADDIKLHSFKTTPRGYIYVRLDKLSNEYGCPSLEELENYSQEYKKRLDETGALGNIPDDLALEVSSPGAERLLKVPDDLVRFKAMPMRVCYIEDVESRGTENDGVFMLDHVELESDSCIWKLANVRENRDPLSKGRPLTRKQKEWRLKLPFGNHQKASLGIELVPIIPSHVHSINDSVSAEEAADEYKFVIRQLVKSRIVSVSDVSDSPKFDLVLLGMGSDGHVASLFPDHSVLEEKDAWVTFITDSPKPPPERITFTLPVINSASNVAIVVTGENKAETVHLAIDDVGPDCPLLPARLVQPRKGKLAWFLDKYAASKLDNYHFSEQA